DRDMIITLNRMAKVRIMVGLRVINALMNR
ncbi:MAG: hypothetical protein ACI845_004381, partial [Gammaproteobacteria bacterium]